MYRVSMLRDTGANDPIRSHQVRFWVDFSARDPLNVRALCSSFGAYCHHGKQRAARAVTRRTEATVRVVRRSCVPKCVERHVFPVA
jgi:hypothetical protein